MNEEKDEKNILIDGEEVESESIPADDAIGEQHDLASCG